MRYEDIAAKVLPDKSGTAQLRLVLGIKRLRKSTLMVVVPVLFRHVFGTYIDHNGAFSDFGWITRSYELGIMQYRQLREQMHSKCLVCMECAGMSHNNRPVTRLELYAFGVTHEPCATTKERGRCHDG